MFQPVVCWILTGVSEELTVFFIGVMSDPDDGGSKLLKHRSISTRLHVATSQKTAMFKYKASVTSGSSIGYPVRLSSGSECS
jgi:hypothetical protein